MNTGLSASKPHGSLPIPNGVLIVDDEKHMRDNLRELIEGLDLPAFTAKDHLAAMKAFNANRGSIGLVLTDLKMDWRNVPQSAGAEFIDWLTQEKARCRIGVFTAFGEMTDLADKTRNPSVAFYLPKTGDPKDLDVVERHVLDALGDYPLAVKANGYGDWVAIAGGQAGAAVWSIDEPIAAAVKPDAAMGRSNGTLRLTLGDMRYRTVATSHGEYLELAGDGLRVLGRPGTPALPVTTKRVALPGSMYELSAEVVDVVEGDWCDVPLPADWVGVLPVPDPQLEGGAASFFVRKDYEQPRNTLLIGGQSVTLDGVPCATVEFCPFRYEPRTRVFKMLRSARIRIGGISAQQSMDFAGPTFFAPDLSSPLAHQILRWPEDRSFPGPKGPSLDGMGGDQREGPPGGHSFGGSRPPRRKRYLAVGTAANLAAIAPLLKEHEARFDVLESVVIGSAPAAAAPEQRTQWILDQLDLRSMRAADKPDYVLLAGGDETIPFHRYGRYRTWDERLTGVRLLSDLRYAKFDRDSEGSVPRFALGRLPFDDPTRLSAYCERAIASPGIRPWRHWLFLCGTAAKWDYPRNVRQVIDMNHATHPLIVDCTRGPAINKPVDPSHVDQLFGGAPSVATFRGHGRRYCWMLDENVPWPTPSPVTASWARLNGVVSVACCTAAPDEPRPGCGTCARIPDCMQYDPLGVTALDTGRALWFLGSTRPSFSEANDVFHTELMAAICSSEMCRIGDAHLAAIIRLLDARDSDPDSELAYSLFLDTAAMSILLGDPAAPIGTPS